MCGTHMWNLCVEYRGIKSFCDGNKVRTMKVATIHRVLLVRTYQAAVRATNQRG